MLEPGPEFLDGIHIWGIWRQEKQGASGIFDKGSGFGGFMESSVVHDDGLPWPQLRKKKILNPGLEKGGVAGAIEGHGGARMWRPHLAATKLWRANRRPATSPKIFSPRGARPHLRLKNASIPDSST